MNEFELIARLAESLPSNATVVRGVGDDCAVLDLGIPGLWMLFKTDAAVGGVHFTKDDIAEEVGHKALGRALSDVAAMGGTASSALVTIGVPGSGDTAYLEGIYAGLGRLAGRFGVAVVGGETTRSPNDLFVSVCVLGTVPRDRCVFRSGAREGDGIFVTGELGGSLAGRHLTFEPRLREGEWLASHFDVHAMIDVSDGVAGDLRHILSASQVGAELLGRTLPVSAAARLKARANSSAKPPLLAALTDGEDFELLFAVAARDAVPLMDAWKERFPGVKLSCIGKVTKETGLRLRDDQNRLREVNENAFMHFQ